MIAKIKTSINGILLLNKAHGISSNKALQQAKRLYNAKKAGHTGTLDPLATGVLPLCFGEATKFSQYVLDSDKVYTVWARLGCTTVTGDAEGEVSIIPNAPEISKEAFEKALNAFVGEISQVPPMYSALKQDGVPLYELARQGKTVERKARNITIYSIKLHEFTRHTEKNECFSQRERMPDGQVRENFGILKNCELGSSSYIYDFKITVHCSKGTYIRTLVEDIGKHLNSGAYLLNLRRDKAGAYTFEQSYTLETLENMNFESLNAILLPADTAVLHFPAIYLSQQDAKKIQQGKLVQLSEAVYSSRIVRLYHENIFLGLGNLSQEGILKAQRLVAI